jgi:hypothetical protein
LEQNRLEPPIPNQGECRTERIDRSLPRAGVAHDARRQHFAVRRQHLDLSAAYVRIVERSKEIVHALEVLEIVLTNLALVMRVLLIDETHVRPSA